MLSLPKAPCSIGLRLEKPFLGQSVKIRESHQLSRPLIHLAPKHKLTQQYHALFLAVEDRVGEMEAPVRAPRVASARRPAPDRSLDV